MVVVFPAPFGPRSPTISLRSTLKETPSTATMSPYALRSPVTESTLAIGKLYYQTLRLATIYEGELLFYGQVLDRGFALQGSGFGGAFFGIDKANGRADSRIGAASSLIVPFYAFWHVIDYTGIERTVGAFDDVGVPHVGRWPLRAYPPLADFTALRDALVQFVRYFSA